MLRMLKWEGEQPVSNACLRRQSERGKASGFPWGKASGFPYVYRPDTANLPLLLCVFVTVSKSTFLPAASTVKYVSSFTLLSNPTCRNRHTSSLWLLGMVYKTQYNPVPAHFSGFFSALPTTL